MTAPFSIDPYASGEVAGLDPLDVVGGQRREDPDADDRHRTLSQSLARNMLTIMTANSPISP